MAERLKALVSKTSVGETQPGVRISLSPQTTRQSPQGLWRFVVAREREIRKPQARSRMYSFVAEAGSRTLSSRRVYSPE